MPLRPRLLPPPRLPLTTPPDPSTPVASSCQADYLCNRLAIMAAGGLECIGTPQYLKTTYGNGYTLEIKSPPATRSEVNLFVAGHFPGARCLESCSGYIK